MNLTEKSVTKLAASTKRVHYYDDELTGFGVRVEPKPEGRKSFFWYAKVNREVYFRALGQFPAVGVSEARTAAKKLIGEAAKWKQNRYEGENPFAKKKRIEPAQVPTFRELAEAYIQNHVRQEANHPEKAEYMARWMLKRHFEGWLDRKVDAITVEDVCVVKNDCGKLHYAANRAVEFVRTLYNWSAKSRDGKINFWRLENPAKDVGSFDEEARDRFLQPDELAHFYKCLKEETHADLRDFLTLAISTGARRSDIFSMRWMDVKWEMATWSVPYPKNGESYDVALLAAAMEVLKRRRAQIPDSEPHVFPGVGRTGHLVDLKGQWNEFRKRAQISDIRLHDLRRTAGSYLAIAGVSLQQIGAALGHKSLQSTQVYAKLHAETVRAARETGAAKMQQMMRAARRRTKLSAGKQKALAAANG